LTTTEGQVKVVVDWLWFPGYPNLPADSRGSAENKRKAQKSNFGMMTSIYTPVEARTPVPSTSVIRAPEVGDAHPQTAEANDHKEKREDAVKPDP
jgi:hypothetical protein